MESEIDAQSGGVHLFARIKEAGLEGVLRPGAFVEVAILQGPYERVVRLPESALYQDATVYKIVDGRLEPVEVELVARDGKNLLVRGPFQPDELVVTTASPRSDPESGSRRNEQHRWERTPRRGTGRVDFEPSYAIPRRPTC